MLQQIMPTLLWSLSTGETLAGEIAPHFSSNYHQYIFMFRIKYLTYLIRFPYTVVIKMVQLL